MSTPREKARNGLLLDGLVKPVDLNAVDWHVRQQNPSASPTEVQNETLEIIRSLVNDGMFRLGAITEGHVFVASDQPLEHSMQKISHVYVRHYGDPEEWIFSVWMELTDKGGQLARSLEAK